jgi:fluoride exporter
VRVVAVVAISGGVGTALRYLVGVAALRAGITSVPVGTLAVNVVGSLALGFFARYFAPPHGSATLFAALTVGLCGGFTTFSTFALDLFGMVERHQASRAAGYALASVLLSYLAVVLGFMIARALRA